MAVERRISWSTYVIAFVISTLLFSVGILVGMQLVQSVNQGLSEELDTLQQRTAELELLALVSDQNAEAVCGIYADRLREFDVQTTEFGQKIDALEQTRGIADAETLKLKREYQLMQVRDYLLIGRINQKCAEQIDTILYFYTNTNCPECVRQGAVGPALKSHRPDVMIYAFDAGLGLSVVDALRTVNNVTAYPTIVANGMKLEGYADEQRIIAALDAVNAEETPAG